MNVSSRWSRRAGVFTTLRPPLVRRTPAATTRPRSFAATVTGVTAITSGSTNRSTAASAQPSVARQPARSTCTTSPALEAIPTFTQSTTVALVGACTNRTSSPTLHGSA